MTEALPPHTLMVTFLHDAIRRRRISVEQLADLLDSKPVRIVRSWMEGGSSPSPRDLVRLAEVLQVSPVELTAGWLADRHPELEPVMRAEILDPLESRFPQSSDYDLIAPRKRPTTWPDLSVPDPHDEREPGAPASAREGVVVLKTSVAARKPHD
jgi:transcriptional regulator with XRE-family HTH domain